MYTQQDLDQVLDNLYQGPLAKRSEGNWEKSFNQTGNTRKLSTRGKKNIVKARNSERTITVDQVLEIKEKYNNNTHLPIDLAKEYGISKNMVWTILLNKYWRFQDEEIYGPPVEKKVRKTLIKEVCTDTVGGMVELSKRFNIPIYVLRRSILEEVNVGNGLRFVKL